MSIRGYLLFAAFAVPSIAVACSSSGSPSTGEHLSGNGSEVDGGASISASSTSGGATPGENGGTSTDGGSSSSSGGPSSTADGGTATTASCSGESTRNACETCCYNAHSQGVAVGANAFGQCACVSPGACASQCAQSYCHGKAPQRGDACDTCIEQQGQGQCGQTSQQACEGSSECVAFEKCLKDSGCETKP